MICAIVSSSLYSEKYHNIMKPPLKILAAAAFLVLVFLAAAAGYIVVHKLRRPGVEQRRVEILSVNEEKQTLTARDKQTGRVFSVHFGEAKEGISVQTGDAAASGMPAWVPRYPGSSPHDGYAASGPESLDGAWHFKTVDSMDKVIGYYAEQLKMHGMSVTESGTHIIGQDQPGKRTVTVNVTSAGGENGVTVTYEAKK
jgi:hypothetical protein